MTFSLLKETMLMADEELHETTAEDQNDPQSTNDTAAVEEGNKLSLIHI